MGYEPAFFSPYDSSLPINFNKGQMIASTLGKDLLNFPGLPFILGTSILIMQVPVLGIWEKEDSNPPLTPEIVAKRIKERNTFDLCVAEPNFLVKRVHNAL